MEEFKEKAKDTAKKAGEKAGEVYEIAKIRAKIIAEQTKIKELYYHLGKEYFYDLENDVDDVSGLEERCEEIRARMAKIDELKTELTKSGNLKLCPNCKVLTNKKNAFCPKCGAKL